MKSFMSSKKATLLIVLSATVVAASAPAAMAMPFGAGFDGPTPGPLLQRTSGEQHRIYPGSESAAAQKARAERNAPNMFCDKQETRCE